MGRNSTSAAGPSSVPAPFEHQEELRALLMLDTLPPGHMTFPILGNDWHPHLRHGEFAVVDMSDRRPVNGEIFLIAYETPRIECGFKPTLCQTRYSERRGNWGTSHQFLPTDPDELRRLLRAGQLSLSDGPYEFDHLASKLIGRVVGVFLPRFDGRRAAA